DISGYFSLTDVDLPPALLNLFLIMKCALFIGQQSGACVLANSCGVPALLCDAFPHRLGTFSPDDVILFKHYRERATGAILSDADVFKNHQDLAYGYHFAQKNIEDLAQVKQYLEKLGVICGKVHNLSSN
ncbi:MAG: TIGR04372 family glycosyltransferase, partial [Bacteroidetes bacterium]|nr:TIGR04372 family glycosyltransferase [Bacteroidota bacterium]